MLYLFDFVVILKTHTFVTDEKGYLNKKLVYLR